MKTRSIKKTLLHFKGVHFGPGPGAAVPAQPKAISFRERGACSVRAKCHYFSVQTSSLGSLRRKRREKRTVSNYTSGSESGGKGERNPGDSQMAARVLSPFSIWLMQSERILPELFKLHGRPSTNPGAQTSQSHSVNRLHTLSKFGRPF